MTKIKTILLEIYDKKEYEFYSTIIDILSHEHSDFEYANLCKQLKESIPIDITLINNLEKIYSLDEEGTEEIKSNIYKRILRFSTKSKEYKQFLAGNYDDFKKGEIAKQIKVTIECLQRDKVLTGKENSLGFQFHIIDTVNQMLDFYRNEGKVQITSKLKNRHFKSFAAEQKEFIKLDSTQKRKNQIRDHYINEIFGILLSLRFDDISLHVHFNVTGIICSEIGLLNSEDEHIDSNRYGNYNKYLRDTIYNILNKNNGLKLFKDIRAGIFDDLIEYNKSISEQDK